MRDKMKEAMEEKKVKRKKEDRKYLIIFLVLMVLGFGGGYFLGAFMGKLKKSGFKLPVITDDFIQTMTFVVPIFVIVLNLILLILAIACVAKAKKSLKVWDGEDEDEAEKIEGYAGLPIVVSSVFNVFNFFLFSVGVNLDMRLELAKSTENLVSILVFGSFVFALVVLVISQKLCVDFIKDMNPEKKGSIYDMKFNSKWIDSCDEAQKLQMYKAGFASYKATNSVCSTLWIVCLCLDLFLEIGLVPITMVTIIWLTGVLSYLIAAHKEEKKNRGKAGE